MSRYRTYKTEANAQRYLGKLRTRYPHKLFRVMPDHQPTFRFVVQVFCEPDRWAYCA